MAQNAADDPTGVLQALTPIGADPPTPPPPASSPASIRVSAAERRYRTRRHQRQPRDPLDATQPSPRGQNPHAEVSLTARRYRRALSSLPVRTLSLSDQLAMAASLTTEFFTLALHHAVCSRCGCTYPDLVPICTSGRTPIPPESTPPPIPTPIPKRTPPTLECGGRVVSLAAASRKNFSVAWAIVQERLMLLQGRPTEILDVQGLERARPAMLALARKVATIRTQRDAVRQGSQDQAAKAANSPQ